MWLVLSTFPAFSATMEIIFLSPSQEKRGKMEKIKINQDPRRGFSELVCSDSSPRESDRLTLDSTGKQGAFTACPWAAITFEVLSDFMVL